MKNIYWTSFNEKEWAIIIAASDEGLSYVGTSMNELESWYQKHYKDALLVENHLKMVEYKKQFQEYFAGERSTFDVPLDLQGTAFQQQVWQALLQIPYGVTTSYSEIANMIHNPKAVRAVGGAIGANPILIVVPCHRIIGKNGKLTGFRSGIPLKKVLLGLENVSYKD
ncbi:methylated-DNA--[protein]-cysteine S-methyltransferase [Rummeliibacillus pycnus]|uniref:methylated-DNA--[protein]-cysteine S-methyltransferase n=1 Tax=Rummeliibacillus pycnus TaxID=101070 RepID=UPI0037C564F2